MVHHSASSFLIAFLRLLLWWELLWQCRYFVTAWLPELIVIGCPAMDESLTHNTSYELSLKGSCSNQVAADVGSRTTLLSGCHFRLFNLVFKESRWAWVKVLSVITFIFLWNSYGRRNCRTVESSSLCAPGIVMRTFECPNLIYFEFRFALSLIVLQLA